MKSNLILNKSYQLISFLKKITANILNQLFFNFLFLNYE